MEPKEVQRILELLLPYVRLKQEHVRLGLEILKRLPLAGDATVLISLCRLVDRFQEINYSKKRTNTSEKVIDYLKSHGYLAPVETDPIQERVAGLPAAKTPVPFAASEG